MLMLFLGAVAVLTAVIETFRDPSPGSYAGLAVVIVGLILFPFIRIDWASGNMSWKRRRPR